MTAYYSASPAAPAWRQPCHCEAYAFPHRPFSGKCRAPMAWAELSVREPMQEERDAFNAREARSINRGL